MIQGEFLAQRGGRWFKILMLVVGSALAVRFGIFIVDSIRASDLWAASMSGVVMLLGLVTGIVFLVSLKRHTPPSLTLGQDTLDADYNRLGHRTVFSLKLGKDTASVTVDGLTLTVAARNGRRYILPAMFNAHEIYAALRDRGVVGGLLTDIDTPTLERKLHSIKRRTTLSIVGYAVIILLSVGTIVWTVFMTGERDISAFTDADKLAFTAHLVVQLFLSVTVFAMANTSGKCRAEAKVQINELTSRAGRAAAQDAPTVNYGTDLSIRCFAEYRSRLIVFKSEKSGKWSFAVEVMRLKLRRWEVLADFSESMSFNSASEATEAAESLLDTEYFEA